MRTFFLNWIVAMTLGTAAHADNLSTAPTDAEILNILTDRIDKQQQSIGIVVGIIDANGRRIVAHGHPAKGDPRPVDGRTVFEIRSVTKVFTALLLADAIEKGTLRLDTPVSTLLPPGVAMPDDKEEPITLKDLATHMSVCRGYPAIWTRQTQAIRMRTTAQQSFMPSCPITSRCDALASSTSTPISAPGFSATRSP